MKAGCLKCQTVSLCETTLNEMNHGPACETVGPLRPHDNRLPQTLPMIPQHYPIEAGKIYGGEYPGHRDPIVARNRLRQLVSLGVRTFVDLTAPADRMTPYEDLLAELEQEASAPLRRISLPIRDMGVPENTETMQTILRHIRESSSQSPAVYIHCWGGVGRTGTVVGCWLRECGHDPGNALARVQHLYASHMSKVHIHPESPQTPAQKDYIRNWSVVR
jgi:hypothetical protein